MGSRIGTIVFVVLAVLVVLWIGFRIMPAAYQFGIGARIVNEGLDPSTLSADQRAFELNRLRKFGIANAAGNALLYISLFTSLVILWRFITGLVGYTFVNLAARLSACLLISSIFLIGSQLVLGQTIITVLQISTLLMPAAVVLAVIMAILGVTFRRFFRSA